jgi:DNA-binding IclR family transcriptional regulator
MPGPVQSIERAAAILRLLARSSERLGTGEVARSLGLARGTVHGLLRTLEQVGFVDRDELGGKYSLGDALIHLPAIRPDIHELRSRSVNWADSLAARSGEAVRIGVLRDGRVLIAHHVFRPDDSPQELDVGTTLPAHATALGKVLLAFEVTIEAAVRRIGLEPYSPRTITDARDLTRELATVRRLGWAAESGELTVGRASIAAPVRGPGGLVVGAIAISGGTERICGGRGEPGPALVGLVRGAADAVSGDLSGIRTETGTRSGSGSWVTRGSARAGGGRTRG